VKRATLSKALDELRRPEGKLLLTHTTAGRAFYIIPCGDRIPDEVAEKLLQRSDIQPADSGLLPGHPQSWRLGDWRKHLKAAS
jgi:hypothetical protein